MRTVQGKTLQVQACVADAASMVRVRSMWAVVAALIVGISVQLAPATASAAAPVTTAAERVAAADIAVTKVGAKYKAGSAGPAAFDCSGLTSFAFQQAGADLGVRSSQDMAKLGAIIRRAGIQKGDLVFTWDKAFGHVGIAISATKYVHAPATGRTVELAPIPAGKALIAVRRP